jgi:hypothetical protein
MMNEDLFRKKVDRNGPVPPHRPELGPCHEWKACRYPRGYGKVTVKGKQYLAHRIAFFHAHGRWPKPCALHHCDNPSCVNPAHLFEGTQQDNIADMFEKGRQPNLEYTASRGEAHGRAQLSDRDVRDIRANALLCRVSRQELADRFGCSKGHVGRIIRGCQRRSA